MFRRPPIGLHSLSTPGEGGRQKEGEVQLLAMTSCKARWHLRVSLQQRLLKFEESYKWPWGGPSFCHIAFLLRLFGDCPSPLKTGLFPFASLVSFWLNTRTSFEWKSFIEQFLLLFSITWGIYIFPALVLSAIVNLCATRIFWFLVFNHKNFVLFLITRIFKTC